MIKAIVIQEAQEPHRPHEQQWISLSFKKYNVKYMVLF